MSDSYKQLHHDEQLGQYPYSVKKYTPDGYPASSVCHGMTKIEFLDSYESEAGAIEAHPDLVFNGEVNYGSAWMDQDLKSVSHIPDEPDYLY